MLDIRNRSAWQRGRSNTYSVLYSESRAFKICSGFKSRKDYTYCGPIRYTNVHSYVIVVLYRLNNADEAIKL